MSMLHIATCLPVLLLLFGSAYAFGKDRTQRFANLLVGFLFSVAAILTIALLFDPNPNSWADANFTWIIIGVAPIGACVGVSVAVWYRLLVR